MSEEEQFKKSKNNVKDESFDEIKSILPPEVLSIKQEIQVDDLKEKFPNLHAEITDKKMIVKIEDMEGSNPLFDELDSVDIFRNFEPSTLDYICRAENDKEAEDIIHFSLKQGNITTEEANHLLDQLRKEGVRSFGPIRTPGYYFRKAAEVRNRQTIKKKYSTPK